MRLSPKDTHTKRAIRNVTQRPSRPLPRVACRRRIRAAFWVTAELEKQENDHERRGQGPEPPFLEQPEGHRAVGPGNQIAKTKRGYARMKRKYNLKSNIVKVSSSLRPQTIPHQPLSDERFNSRGDASRFTEAANGRPRKGTRTHARQKRFVRETWTFILTPDATQGVVSGSSHRI